MATKKLVQILFFACALVLGLGVFLFWNGTDREVRQISINDQALEVFVADSRSEWANGLSNIELEEFAADGMLFIFDDSDERTFWMNEMLFDIDIVWIEDGEVVKVETEIPAPQDGEIRYMYSEPFKVDAALELPAGGVDNFGIDTSPILYIN